MTSIQISKKAKRYSVLEIHNVNGCIACHSTNAGFRVWFQTSPLDGTRTASRRSSDCPPSAPVVQLIFRWQEVAGPFPQTSTWWVHFIHETLPK